MTEPSEFFQTAARDIVITNATLEYGNIEAWINIIKSYQQSHPDHEVVILYEEEPVKSMISLFKMEQALNRDGFQMLVRAPDKDWKDIPKLYRLLVEGGSPKFNRYLQKEMFQVLKLF